MLMHYVNALCQMVNALCQMVNALCQMVDDKSFDYITGLH